MSDTSSIAERPTRNEDVRDGWMALLQMGESNAYIYDPRNGYDDPLSDDLRNEMRSGRSELTIVRGAERPELMVADNGELLGWGNGSSLMTVRTRAFAVDDMDALGFDDAQDIVLLWTRAHLFVDALNALDFAEVAA